VGTLGESFVLPLAIPRPKAERPRGNRGGFFVGPELRTGFGTGLVGGRVGAWGGLSFFVAVTFAREAATRAAATRAAAMAAAVLAAAAFLVAADPGAGSLAGKRAGLPSDLAVAEVFLSPPPFTGKMPPRGFLFTTGPFGGPSCGPPGWALGPITPTLGTWDRSLLGAAGGCRVKAEKGGGCPGGFAEGGPNQGALFSGGFEGPTPRTEGMSFMFGGGRLGEPEGRWLFGPERWFGGGMVGGSLCSTLLPMGVGFGRGGDN